VAQAPEGKPTNLQVVGTINALPLALDFESDPLQSIVEGKFPLYLKAVSNIGSAELEAIIDVLDTGLQISVELKGKNLNQLNEKLGLQLPAVQNYQASASIDYDGRELKINSFQANFDDSAINAELNIVHGEEPLKISGVVDIKSLDLDPFIDSVQHTVRASTEQESDQITPNENPKVDEISNLVKQLSNYAVDLSVDIGRLTVGDIVVSDSRLQLDLADGKLDTPINVVLNDIPMEGNLSLLGEDPTLSASAFLSVENNDIGDLEKWFKLDGIDGSLGKFSLNAEAKGHDLQSLLEQLTTSLVIEGAELRFGGNENAEGVPFSLERLSASAAGHSPLKIDIDGALLDEAFNVSVAGGELLQLLKDKEWPISIAGSGAGANLRVEGIVRKPGEQVGSELELILSGSDLGDLHAWLGVAQDADFEYKISASARTHSAGWEASSYEVALGSSNLKGKVTAAKKPDGALFDVEILSDLINVPELTSFFPEPETAPDDAPEPLENQPSETVNLQQFTDSALSIPILPKGVSLPDTDIKVSINELRTGAPSFRDIKFSGSIRDGILNSSPFSMQLEQAVFTGDIAFDSLSTPPSISLLVETRKIDIGDLLDKLQVANGIDLSAELLRLQIDLKGHRLGAILNQSNITAEIRQGKWVLTDRGSGSEFPLALRQGTLSIEPNSPFSLINLVEYNGEQITISITMDRLLTKKQDEDVSLEIDVQYDDNVLSLKGTSPLPIDIDNTVMSLNMNGTNTGSLRIITGLPVPAIGPYKLVGRFTLDSQGYYLEKMQTQIGESVLEGSAKLRTNLSVPEFDVQLVSEHFQLNDFQIPKQSSLDQPAQEASTESAPKITADSAETENEQVSVPFDAKGLAMINGSFNLKAKDVVSGDDWLGEGEINLNLRDSKLDITPIKVKLPGGNFDASLTVLAKDKDLDVHLNAMIDQFDYGVLARHNNPETKMSGVIDLDIALESKAPTLDTLLANANGYIDFALLPEYFEAGIIDLWAASLLVAVLPRLGSDVSLINCVIARFDIEDGLMKEKELYLDTSKLRAGGKGTINFKDQTISYLLKPKAKNPGLFQVQAPLKIDGSFANLQFGLDGGILGTALGMATTTLTVPIRILMGKNVPKDGSDICIPLAAREVKE
jgi:uncharacterized protein involved in outer membrane biogenesis